MILFVLFCCVAAQRPPPQEKQSGGSVLNQAKKLMYGFKCRNFGMEFIVTKRQLYRSTETPKTNKFIIGGRNNCIKELSSKMVKDKEGKRWMEVRKSTYLDFFRENNLENCGMSLSQDEYGIRTELLVAGRRPSRQGSPIQPRIIVFSCFYPMNDVDRKSLPPDLKQYMRNTFVIGERSIQLRKHGEIKVPFELYDVAANMTGKFYPNTDTPRIVNVGDPIIVGMVPKPIWENGFNVNPIFKWSARWDYFMRDCVLKGTKNGTEMAIQLLSNNCKTRKYQVQMLTKVGLKNDGHMVMFEAIAFDDSLTHNLQCTVDICLKTREGVHLWPTCYKRCDNTRWFTQSADERGFLLPTTTERLEPTTKPTTAPDATTVPEATKEATTQFTSVLGPEPMEDLESARAVCVEHGKFLEASPDHHTLWELCRYIMIRFPEDFQ